MANSFSASSPARSGETFVATTHSPFFQPTASIAATVSIFFSMALTVSIAALLATGESPNRLVCVSPSRIASTALRSECQCLNSPRLSICNSLVIGVPRQPRQFERLRLVQLVARHQRLQLRRQIEQGERGAESVRFDAEPPGCVLFGHAQVDQLLIGLRLFERLEIGPGDILDDLPHAKRGHGRRLFHY